MPAVDGEERGSIAALLEDELRAKPPAPVVGAIEHGTLPSAAPPLIHDPRLAEMSTGQRGRPDQPRAAKIGLVLGLVAIVVLALSVLLVHELRRPNAQTRPPAPAVSVPEPATPPNAGPVAVPSAAPSAGETPAQSAAPPTAATPTERPPTGPRVAPPGPAPQPAGKPHPKRKKNYVPDDL
jgi:hypothetical protein